MDHIFFFIVLLFFKNTYTLNQNQLQDLQTLGCEESSVDVYLDYETNELELQRSTTTSKVYKYSDDYDLKLFDIVTNDYEQFDSFVNEVKKMNLFSYDLDFVGSVPSKCKYVFKQAEGLLSVYIAVPATSSDLEALLDLPKPFEVNLYYALKLTMMMYKMHKANYLHGDIQPQNFLMFNNYVFTLGDLQYLQRGNYLQEYNTENPYLDLNEINQDQTLSDNSHNGRIIENNPELLGRQGTQQIITNNMRDQMSDSQDTQQVYDKKSEIYAFGLILKQLFSEDLLEDEYFEEDPNSNEDLDRELLKLKLKKLKTLQIELKGFPQEKQQLAGFLIEALDKMTEENKQERMNSLEEIFKVILKMYQIYYKKIVDVTNFQLFRQKLNAQINEIKNKNLRLFLVQDFQKLFMILHKAINNQDAQALIDKYLDIKTIENNRQHYLLQQEQVQNDGSSSSRFSQVQSRQSYMQNQLASKGVDNNIKNAIYYKKEAEKEVAQQRKDEQRGIVKNKDDKQSRGFCGLFFI